MMPQDIRIAATDIIGDAEPESALLADAIPQFQPCEFDEITFARV